MKKLIVICGATASGKTALAVECAKAWDGEVVSCDALLVYRGLNIGTAKPTKEEMGGVPHHLIDVADPRAKFSVHDFEMLALPVVKDILARGKTPVLCGGTGFYMNAILFKSGFGHAAGDEAVRKKYEDYAAAHGKEARRSRRSAIRASRAIPLRRLPSTSRARSCMRASVAARRRCWTRGSSKKSRDCSRAGCRRMRSVCRASAIKRWSNV